MRERLLERVRRALGGVRVVVGEQQPVACHARAGRRTRSCRRRRRARRRSSRACCRERSGRRPCGRRAAVGSSLTSRAPVCRPVGVALATRDDRRPAARARPPGPAVHPRLDRARPVARRQRHPRPHRLDDRDRLGVGHLRHAAATDRPRPPSSPRPSRCSRCPATLRWSSSASPIARVWSSERSRAQEARESNSSAQHVRAERASR